MEKFSEVRDGHTTTLTDEAAEAATLLFGNGEEDGPRMVHAALLRLLRLAEITPSAYTIAREILSVGLLLPQEAKGAYINGLARLFKTGNTDPADWLKFRGKLQGLLLKAQALVQAGEMLLQDWQIEDPKLKQLDLFASAQSRRDVPDMTGGRG